MKSKLELYTMNTKGKDLDYWLENISVLPCEDMIDDFEQGERMHNLNELLSGWYAVANTEGIIAYFGNKSDAFRFRLNYINLMMNGNREV